MSTPVTAFFKSPSSVSTGEFQLAMVKSSEVNRGEGWATQRMHVMPLNYTFAMVKMVTYDVFIFPQFF